jgi:hypothetical protein
MAEAREIIARAEIDLFGATGEAAADAIMAALTAAGFRIIPPGELDAETLERAAYAAERTFAHDNFRFELGTACAAAIRSLSPKGGTP